MQRKNVPATSIGARPIAIQNELFYLILLAFPRRRGRVPHLVNFSVRSTEPHMQC